DLSIEQAVPSLVLYTSLSDTLPASTIEALGLADITGIKVKSYNGKFANYFKYEANRNNLITEFSILPFQRSAHLADTTCHKMAYRDFELLRAQVSDAEKDNASFFWQASEDEFDVYQSIKPPLRHTLLISRNSNTIFHRADPVM